MKRDIADFVSKCPNCQQVKVEHQKPEGMTQDIDIPTWKWDVINMNFITGLPRTSRQYDSIWVIVDRMTKSSHFLAVKTKYSAEDYAKLYLTENCEVAWGSFCLSSQIEVLSLPLIFGSYFKKVFVLKLTLVQHFIHKRMGRQSVPFRP